MSHSRWRAAAMLYCSLPAPVLAEPVVMTNTGMGSLSMHLSCASYLQHEMRLYRMSRMLHPRVKVHSDSWMRKAAWKPLQAWTSFLRVGPDQEATIALICSAVGTSGSRVPGSLLPRWK